jgi:hypothetical protein
LLVAHHQWAANRGGTSRYKRQRFSLRSATPQDTSFRIVTPRD